MDSKTFYFVKTHDGRYLQSQWEGGTMRFWLEAHSLRAWTGCHSTMASAEQYRTAAAGTITNDLIIVEEAL